jgi:uncharacterized protein (DUF1778 family)
MPKASKAAVEAHAKYNAKSYDRFYPFAPKGHKAEVQAAADSVGESLNDFIMTATDERMKRLVGGKDTITITVSPMEREFIEQAAESLNENVDEYMVNAANEHIRRIRE